MTGRPSGFPVPDQVRLRPGRQVGHRVHWHDSLDSTNEQALRLAASLAEEPSLHGVAITAGSQRHGRGQHGRVWMAPPLSSVLVSVLLDLDPEASRPALLTAWAAVATRAAAARWLPLKPRIKWPNDIYLSGRKIAGILVEKGRGTVVGVGLNISQTEQDFLAAGLELGGSLAMFNRGLMPSHAEVLEGLLDSMDHYLPAIQRGETRELEGEWREGLGLVGTPVRLEAVGRVALGVVEEVTFRQVVLAQDDGARRRFTPEEILRIHPLGDFLNERYA
jgi:BirA family biotin operon repressor/biotin-[acetyl-CoA-carboxylase] ligase